MWVTGNSGAGKSTVCALLQTAGHAAVDADDDGYCAWFDRRTGEVVDDPPDPVPSGWLDRFGWAIVPAEVQRLAAESRDRVVFLCGSAENEPAVRDLLDLIVCLVTDDETLRSRLKTRMNNAFGQHPEELAAALMWNPRMRPMYERLGAIIIDTSSKPPDKIAQLVLDAARGLRAAGSRPRHP